MKLKLLTVFFCMRLASGIAAEPAQPALLPEGIPAEEFPTVQMVRWSIGEPTQPREVHLFGGQSVKVDFSVFAERGIMGMGMEMRADVFQKAQSILAPVQKDIVVAHQFRGGRDTNLLTWSYQAPEVKRETHFIVRFRFGVPDRVGVPVISSPAGELFLTVYPPDFAKEDLARFAKDPGLRVFGSDPLRKFLTAQKTEFEDAGTDLADLPSNPEGKSVFVGEATSRQFAQWLAAHPGWQGNLVVFCTDTPLLPGVFVTTQGGFRIVKVTLPILDALSTDPRSQKTLIEILNSITAP